MQEPPSSSEKNFQGFLEAIDDLVFVGNSAGEILYVNPAVVRKLGYSLQELQGMHILDVHPQKLRREAEKIFSDIFAGTSHSCLLPLQTRWGAYLPVETRVWFGTWDGEKAMFGLSKDLSRERKAEEKLQFQLKMQDLLMNLASDFINLPLEKAGKAIRVSLRKLGRFVGADRAYVFDYDFENQTTSNTYEWCAPGVSPQIDDLQQVPLEYVTDWVNHHKKGQIMSIPDVLALPMNSGIRKILEPQGIKSLLAIPMMKGANCIGFVGFDSVKQHHAYDEKEVKLLGLFSQVLVNIQIRAELQEANVKAQVSSKAKGDFLTNLSHEVRTPLSGVLATLELLKDRLQDEEMVYLVGLSLESMKRLDGVFDDLYDITAIGSGKLCIEPKKMDLSQLLDEVFQMFQIAANEKGVHFSLERTGLPRWIVGDDKRIQQILDKVVDNAIKFTLAGSVALQCSYREVNPGMGIVSFTVADTGIGMDKKTQQRIFDAFYQADYSTTRQFEGLGLGLPIVGEIVHKMQGTIQVQSDPGKGTTFIIEIPVKTY